MDLLAEPDVLNEILSIAFQDNKDQNKNLLPKDTTTQKVQLLKHWTQMNGCIFKPVSSFY